MVRSPAPARRKGPKAAGRAQEGRGPDPGSGSARRFPPAASPIVVRATAACIHSCGRCESHPCRLKGQL
ncbi:hypothetical protein [Geothrix rubra]|uniref:hypothetical protein n=1 Tax=Geothrix rubra TaxID=2927977 RepID=UPI002553EC06|nr:hypothetical protein [Geothrix rubra]